MPRSARSRCSSGACWRRCRARCCASGLVVEQVHNAGALSLVIIMICGLFVGMVLGVLGYDVLQRFGSEEALGTARRSR